MSITHFYIIVFLAGLIIGFICPAISEIYPAQKIKKDYRCGWLMQKNLFSRSNVWISPTTAFISVLILQHFSITIEFTFFLVYMYGLILVSYIDGKYRIIPNQILIILLLWAILMNSLFEIISWIDAITGMILSFGLMFIIRLLGNALFHQESLGMGDIKLGAVLGFYSGFVAFTISLIYASLLAIMVFYISLPWRTARSRDRIPLAPYLAAGNLIAILIPLQKILAGNILELSFQILKI